MSQYIILMQQYLKAVNRARNLAEERESKLFTFIQLARVNNLNDLETKGVPLML
jgi:hypothetical protein